jgi:hypothetical protein
MNISGYQNYRSSLLTGFRAEKMLISFPFFACHFWWAKRKILCENYIFHVFSEARDHILILNILFFKKLRQIIPEVRSEMRDLLTFLNHLLALDNVFSTKSEEQEVNLLWPNLVLIFDCPSSVYTTHDHDLFRTLSKWISVDIKIIGQVCLRE